MPNKMYQKVLIDAPKKSKKALLLTFSIGLMVITSVFSNSTSSAFSHSTNHQQISFENKLAPRNNFQHFLADPDPTKITNAATFVNQFYLFLQQLGIVNMPYLTILLPKAPNPQFKFNTTDKNTAFNPTVCATSPKPETDCNYRLDETKNINNWSVSSVFNLFASSKDLINGLNARFPNLNLYPNILAATNELFNIMGDDSILGANSPTISTVLALNKPQQTQSVYQSDYFFITALFNYVISFFNTLSDQTSYGILSPFLNFWGYNEDMRKVGDNYKTYKYDIYSFVSQWIYYLNFSNPVKTNASDFLTLTTPAAANTLLQTLFTQTQSLQYLDLYNSSMNDQATIDQYFIKFTNSTVTHNDCGKFLRWYDVTPVLPTSMPTFTTLNDFINFYDTTVMDNQNLIKQTFHNGEWTSLNNQFNNADLGYTKTDGAQNDKPDFTKVLSPNDIKNNDTYHNLNTYLIQFQNDQKTCLTKDVQNLINQFNLADKGYLQYPDGSTLKFPKPTIAALQVLTTKSQVDKYRNETLKNFANEQNDIATNVQNQKTLKIVLISVLSAIVLIVFLGIITFFALRQRKRNKILTAVQSPADNPKTNNSII